MKLSGSKMHIMVLREGKSVHSVSQGKKGMTNIKHFCQHLTSTAEIDAIFYDRDL